MYLLTEETLNHNHEYNNEYFQLGPGGVFVLGLGWTKSEEQR